MSQSPYDIKEGLIKVEFMRHNPNPSLVWNPNSNAMLYPLLPGKPISPTRLGVFKAATTHKPQSAEREAPPWSAQAMQSPRSDLVHMGG